MIKKCLIIVVCCVGLIGCRNNNNEEKFGNAISPTDVVQTETTDSASEENIRDIIDYTQYLKKIWVVKSWNGGAYDYSSFFISKIDNKIIEGKFSTHSIARPDFYFYSFEPSKYLGALSGTVNNSVAESCFSDKVGNKGNVTLVLKQNNEIEATIEYTDKRPVYKDLSLDGVFSFRPYNLKDIENFMILDDDSFVVDLNSWGNVNLVSGKIDTSNKVHPVAYLTNEYDDILYIFEASFKTGSEIIDAYIRDINDDGLKDVVIITSFADPEIAPLKFTLFQKDNGLFYNADLNENP